jgi:H+/Cl- antiporter ClcA
MDTKPDLPKSAPLSDGTTPLPPALPRELTDWRIWWARVLIAGAAAAAGLTVVGFTWLAEGAAGQFSALFARWWWSPLLWTPACAAGIAWCTRRFAPGAAGSGIPQVMAALDSSTPQQHTNLFVSLRLSLAKILLTSWGLLGGLSVGREGPSVQVAAGVMLLARRFMPARAPINLHGLLVAGGAAGIAAAFNTPLGGIMFAIEELARSPEQRSSGIIVGAIVLAGVISISAHGNATYFGVIYADGFGWHMLAPAVLTAFVAGICGGVFSRLLIASISGASPDPASRLRARRPVLFAALCGLLVGALGIATGGAVFGGGYASTRAMVDGAATMPPAYALFKLVATWLTAWTGIPAGIFAPSLAIGAALGNDVALLWFGVQTPALIALGMVGFLAAATQAPLTAFIIVMEMVDGHAMVLSLMACALVARLVSRTISPPLYPTLARLQLARMPPPAPQDVPDGKL